jgi:hypothetical protein
MNPERCQMPFAKNIHGIRQKGAKLVNPSVSKYTTPVVMTYICT